MICKFCGKEFKPRLPSQITCAGVECKKALNRENVRKWKEKRTKENPLKNEPIRASITDIAIKARASGMSYGEYVVKHNL
jgi:hypothetical protein